MNIAISQQVSATYARNHFKEVNNLALKNGLAVIINKSKPSIAMLPFSEYEKIQTKLQAYEKNQPTTKPSKKITLKELRKDSIFTNIEESFNKTYPGKTALDIQHEWYKLTD